MACQIELFILSGPRAGKRVRIPSEGATLGRSRMSDIPLEDELLSRQHCRFFVAGEEAFIQDLGSSNGTLVNGLSLGEAPQGVREGDLVTVGNTVFRVSLLSDTSPAPAPAPAIEKTVKTTPSPMPAAPAPTFTPSPAPMPATVDLGLGEPPAAAPKATEVPKEVDLGLSDAAQETHARKSPLRGLIFALGALLLLVVGAVGVSMALDQQRAPAAPRQLPSVREQPFEFHYESLRIDQNTLYRYTLTYESTGMLSLTSVDLGEADRSFKKEQKLSEQSQASLRKELLESQYAQIPQIYPEDSADGVSLNRKRLTIAWGSDVWSRTAENASVRKFDALCERLENFARLELGVVATKYSVSELEAMAQEQLTLARAYWEQRDLDDEKLFRSVTAYEQGLNYLLTLNPKPAFAVELTKELSTAEALLTERYETACFEVEQARATMRYEDARDHLQRILRMIPNRDDERNLKASQELRTIERFLMKGGRRS